MLQTQDTKLWSPVSSRTHPIEQLLNLAPKEILERMFREQRHSFEQFLSSDEIPMSSIFPGMMFGIANAKGGAAVRIRDSIARERLLHLFGEFHTHVMMHPVWVHPFFCRFSEGYFTSGQLAVFGQNYFNQVKNTRQCVARALGRLHSHTDLGYGDLDSWVSEAIQKVLAHLLADEYGVSCQEDLEDQPPADIAEMFAVKTHGALYRDFLNGIGIFGGAQDVAMLPSVAANTRRQLELSGDPGYSVLEALASVGLGMEWGVPAFFSMIISGLKKHEVRNGRSFDASTLEIWSAHVRQDVAHAISVFVVTAMLIHTDDDVIAVKRSTDILMECRYDMMTELHQVVFGEIVPSYGEMVNMVRAEIK